jgi:hypothetical protein
VDLLSILDAVERASSVVTQHAVRNVVGDLERAVLRVRLLGCGLNRLGSLPDVSSAFLHVGRLSGGGPVLARLPHGAGLCARQGE